MKGGVYRMLTKEQGVQAFNAVLLFSWEIG